LERLTPYSKYPGFTPFYRGMGQSLSQPPGTLSTTSTQVGGSLLATSSAVALANPIAGAAVAAAGGVADLVGAVAKLFQGCGQTCTEATSIVSQVEPYLQQNNQIYFTNPYRTTGDQANAIATAQQIFAIVKQQCGNPALGTAGQNCISDRLGTGMNVGSSKCWATTQPNSYPPYCSVPYPVGVCWTWNLAYLDPIQNDDPPGGNGAATASPAPSGSTSTSSASSTGTTDYTSLILLAAAVVGLVMVMR
jgi:hypothetical protein